MMQTSHVREAADIIRVATSMLMATTAPQVGRAGSDLRRACGDMAANAEKYITYNTVASPLAHCFDQARLAGATLDGFNRIREVLVAIPEQAPLWRNSTAYVIGQQATDGDSGIVYKCLTDYTSSATGSFKDERALLPNNWGPALSLVAVLITQSMIAFCLQQMSLVLITITFTSRDDVDSTRIQLNDAFKDAEEVAADAMAQQQYQTLIALHAAVMFHLYSTAQPLPQMLNFRFAAIRPTLIQSYRLYADAGRADELRAENKVVHPAFAPRAGRALSF